MDAQTATGEKQWRVVDIIEWGSGFLGRHEIPNPRLNIELLLGNILDKKRLDLYLSYDRVLTKGELERLKGDVQRRSRHEPVQYIIGKTEFYGIELGLTPACLIPRPETEILVDTILKRYAPGYGTEPVIADVGTGPGTIAIALAKHIPAASVYAVDISPGALSVARANARRQGVDGRIVFLEGDLCAVLPEGVVFDIIVSNPPYIRSGEFDRLPREIREYEPAGALLAGDADGNAFYEAIITGAHQRLRTGGVLAFEVGDDRQAGDVEKLFDKSSVFSTITRFPDYNNVGRVVAAEKR